MSVEVDELLGSLPTTPVQKPPETTAPVTTTSTDRLQRAVAAAEKWPGVPEGKRNQEAEYHAAYLTHDFALSREEARPILQTWNLKNTPSLKPEEVDRCLDNGIKYGKHPVGEKLVDQRPRRRQRPDPADSPSTIIIPKPVYVRIQDVQAKPVHWFWRNRIPFAMLCLLVGLEGLGKTFLALYMAARATQGRLWPDSESMDDAPVAGNVIILTSEDHLEYTIRPRFDALGGDPARLFALKGIKYPEGDDFFDVTRHLPALETMIEEVGDVRLVIVDPLTAFLGSTDQHKNGEVRMALARFNALAEKHGCAVLGISHLSKDTSKAAIHRTLGSVAFSAAARAIWIVAQDREDAERRLFVPVKMNLGPMAKSLAFRIQDMAVEWENGQFEYGADEVLAVGDAGEGSVLADACQWLKDALGGGKVRSTELYAMAAKEKFCEKTLKRAKAKLHVEAVHDGIGKESFWYWQLPQGGPK